MRNHAVQRAGFTLVELLAVMMIIGILAGLILGVSSYASRKASESKAVAEMQKIKNACEEYKIKYGKYPGTQNARITNAPLLSLSNFVSDLEYTDKAYDPFTGDEPVKGIVDPWGNAYCVSNLGFSIRVISAGQDVEDKNKNTADDIDSNAAQ
ncbi:MAG: type II secretion system protein GspG [Kiritimatiellae bacterium]|nr:type II secretion system protein GspG [Kiritimatiellia bacterium]